MKIALLGYGKMGQEIEKIALQRGHKVVLKIFYENAHELTLANLQQADIAIEFSTPSTAVRHINACFEANVPVVVGTTGWYEQFESIQEACLQKGQGLLYATNFSIGVNLFFQLNKQLADLMDTYKEYQPSMTEVHHTQKLDYPSGTAITLAEGLLEHSSAKNSWKAILSGKDRNIATAPEELLITSVREEHVPGTHVVTYASAVDEIEIKHTAHNRKGFSEGAVIAAEWLKGKKGLYGMKDVLGF